MIEMRNTMNFFKGAFLLRTIEKLKSVVQNTWQFPIKRYKMLMVKSMGSLGLVAVITVGGNQYVNANMNEVYHVYVDGQEAGVVSNPQIVDNFKLKKIKELKEKNPDVHMALNTDEITLSSEKAFKSKSDDALALSKLDSMLIAHAVGVELVVDGKLIGIVKDKEEAEGILEQIKSKYLPKKLKSAGKVSILSAPSANELNVGETQVEKAEFVQKVDMNQTTIDPKSLMSPADVIKRLETGDVQPKKYKVVEGDCVSCIAQKFNISRQLIYNNNPALVEDDQLKLGQVLDLTLLEPTLSVRTVEKVVEKQEVQFDTEYKLDESLRAGIVHNISPGVNGMKKVTIQLTKLNGLMENEVMLSEEMVIEPQSAVAVKGTKVIQGEGTGKFSWPVIDSSLTSGFGMRWGKVHKGVDLTGNRSILASDNGQVIYAGYKSDYGNHIIIDHLNGYKTVYGHLSKISVTVGSTVEKGEKIGIMGNTGDSTGTHLHFEVRRDDSPQNPLKYLNR
jgi:murein DD-endopeptidase MepM/ murein hydrolase activator NlpD